MTKASLPELVGLVQQIEQEEADAIQSGQTLPEEQYYQKEILSKLIAGRVDQAVELKNALESHVDALKAALAKSNLALERVEEAFKKTLEISSQNRIDGLAWSVRLQNNSRSAVIVDDESKIPSRFWRYTATASESFSTDDLSTYLFWASVTLKRPITEESLSNLSEEDRQKIHKSILKSYSKSDLESALKENPEGVPGARLERGRHVRFGKGESRPKSIEEKS